MTLKLNFEKKFVFNGKEYSGLEEMPPDIRELYQKVMKAAAAGNAPGRDLAAAAALKAQAAPRTHGSGPTLSFSIGPLFILALAALAGLAPLSAALLSAC